MVESIKIATVLNANGTENFNEHSGDTNKKIVIKNAIQIEQHQTQERIPARSVSGMMDARPCSSWIIPDHSLSLRNVLHGPVSFTKRDAMRQTAIPYMIRFIVDMEAFYRKTRMFVIL